MSTENVEELKKGFEAASRGDIEALVAMVHPDFEGIAPPDLSTEPQTYRGQEGVRRWFASFYEVMDDIRMEPEEFIDAGDRVVVPLRLMAKGRDSGLEVEQRLTQVWTMRNGKGVRVEAYPDKESALEALDLAG